MARLSQTLSVACMSAFAGGCLVVSTVLVPSWRAMDSDRFLEWFGEHGPTLGRTLFPLDIAGTVFTVHAFLGARKGPAKRRWLWGLASLCSGATVGLLPLYFAGANTRLLNKTIAGSDVTTELAAWSRWQWLRTGLAGLAVVCGGWGIRQTEGNAAPNESRRVR